MNQLSQDFVIHQIATVGFVLAILAIILNFLIGLVYLRNAIRSHQIDLALAILLGLYAIILLIIPDKLPIWNYLGLGWLALLLIFVGKDLFSDFQSNSLQQKLIIIFGILMIIAAVLIGLYVPMPDWIRELPTL